MSDEETDLIFMGSFIKSEVIEGFYTAWQFEVIKIYHGEIITPSSVHYTGEEYINTDSTVWIISSGGNLCTSNIKNETAIFTLSYNYSPGVGLCAEYGYAPLICSPDYFPIASNNTVEGFLFGGLQRDTVTVEELEELIYNCMPSPITSTDENINDQFEKGTIVYPQPTNGELIVNTLGNHKDWSMKLYNMSGKEIMKLNSNKVDLTAYEAGVYFIQFVKDRQRFAKKIIKI